MKQNTPKTKKLRRKISFGGWFLIVSTVIVVSIAIGFAWILWDAMQATGSITVGDRFQLELNPAIDPAKVEDLKTALKAEPFAAKTSVNLRSATLRIMVQVKPELTDAQLAEAIVKIKDDVQALIPLETYFTSTTDVKMYDLEIHVYNSEEPVSTETFKYHYFIFVKNANMVTWKIQEVSTAVNPTLADALRAKLNAVPVTQ